MSEAEDGTARGRLAYVYHPRSFATLLLANTARELCDIVWVIDSSNSEAVGMARLLRRFGTIVDVAGLSVEDAAAAIAAEHPDGILALMDELLQWTSEVAEKLALPFHSPATARTLTDKFTQRAALRNAGLPTPRVWLLDETDLDTGLATVEAEATFPVVLKPRIGVSSRDTMFATSFEELRAEFDEVHVGVDGVHREFIVEEYIPDADHDVAGEGYAGYVSVEGFVSHGRTTPLAISGRTPMAPPFRETSLIIPGSLQPEDADAVVETAVRAADAVGLTLGFFHTEIKLTPTGPVVIEVNGRVGGGVPETLEAASGVRVLDIAFRLALGEDVVVPPMPTMDRVAYRLASHLPPDVHRVTEIDGLDELAALPGVAGVTLNRGVGQQVDWREGSIGGVFDVYGTAADHDELLGVIRFIEERVVVRGE
jgi:biotin carboxylase